LHAVSLSEIGRHTDFCAPLANFFNFLLTVAFAFLISPSAALIRDSVISTAHLLPINVEHFYMDSPSLALHPDPRIVSATQSDAGIGGLGSGDTSAAEGSISDIWSFNSRIARCKSVEVSLSPVLTLAQSILHILRTRPTGCMKTCVTGARGFTRQQRQVHCPRQEGLGMLSLMGKQGIAPNGVTVDSLLAIALQQASDESRGGAGGGRGEGEREGWMEGGKEGGREEGEGVVGKRRAPIPTHQPIPTSAAPPSHPSPPPPARAPPPLNPSGRPSSSHHAPPPRHPPCREEPPPPPPPPPPPADPRRARADRRGRWAPRGGGGGGGVRGAGGV
jgi:hypothetical protein